MDDEFDRIDDPTKNCNPGKLAPRPRAEKLAARRSRRTAGDWENATPSTMLDLTSLQYKGDDHAG